jgi:hypothetical protein
VLLLLSVLKQVAPIRAASSVSLRWIQTGLKNQWIDSHDGDNINDNNSINNNTIKNDDNLDDSTIENKDNNDINDNTDYSTVAGVLKAAAFKKIFQVYRGQLERQFKRRLFFRFFQISFM